MNSFDELPTKRKDEVFSLARDGRRHPDPRVARLAWDWSRQLDSLGVYMAKLAFAVTISASLGDSSGGGPGAVIAARRTRKLINALGPPEAPRKEL